MRPDYLILRPYGSVVDTRLRFGRDDRVRITQGPYPGLVKTVDTAPCKITLTWASDHD